MPANIRSAGNDSNPAGASGFVAIPSLTGLKEFDLCLAFLTVINDISNPNGIVPVTAPPGWILLQRIQDAVISQVVFYKYATSPEPPNWVWTIGTVDQHTGVAIAYSGMDLFVPVDATALLRNPSSTSQPLPTVVTSGSSGMLVAAISTPATETVTPAAGFTERAIKSQTGSQTEISDHLQPLAGTVSGLSATLSGATTGLACLVALRPSAGVHGLDEVREGLIDLLPPGSRDWMDLDPGGDWYRFYEAEAALIKKWGFDLVDTLRAELDPAVAFQKVPDWEQALNLIRTRQALQGSIPARRAQVVSRLRESGASTKANLQSIVGPILGYADPTQLVVLEVHRSDLAAANTYTDASGGSIPGPGTFTTGFTTHDDGNGISKGGVRLTVALSTANLEDISVVVTGPAPVHNLANPGPPVQGTATFIAGSAAVVGHGTYWRSIFAPDMELSPTIGSTWFKIRSVEDDTHLTLQVNSPSSGTGAIYQRLSQAHLTWAAPMTGFPAGAFAGSIVLFGNQGSPAGPCVGCQLLGGWTVAVSSSGAGGTVTNVALFVEGVGRDSAGGDGQGAEIFDWGVLVDHGLEGATNPPDYDEARAALARFTQAHDLGSQSLIFSSSNTFLSVSAIPDDIWAIPDACIPA